jgi:CDP-diacylglycerol---glycerol-3-phosphate 3-phosphatidyltransferase
MHDESLLTVPNLLSLLRLMCAPILVISGLAESSIPFFVILSLMLLSDAIDGWLARKLQQTSVLGARLDSYGDYATYMAVALGAWLQWPGRIEREAPVILLIMFIFIVPALVSMLKFRRFVSYHTLTAKLSAVLMSFGIFTLLVFDWSWPLYLAAVVLIVEAAENIAITMTLDVPRTDIRSYFSLRRRV